MQFTVKLLIVDDEKEICDFLKEFFEERSYRVVTANNGPDALERVKSEKPALMLLDMKMPGMDGIEVLKQVKKIAPEVKVIMVTAVGTQDKINEALDSGADNYITKPLSLDYLEDDVKKKVAQILMGESRTSA
jgi:DNA-binding response OmpR family regulator